MHLLADVYQIVICEDFQTEAQNAPYTFAELLRVTNKDNSTFDHTEIDSHDVVLLKGQYGVKKLIGSYAAAMGGVDAIVFTGGMAYEQFFCDDITAYVGKIARTIRLPGEEEMRSLAEGALRVLHGQAQPLAY